MRLTLLLLFGVSPLFWRYRHHRLKEACFKTDNCDWFYASSWCAIFNKLTSVFYASVLLLIMNFVIILSAIASWIHSYFDNVMTKFIVHNRTDALKTDINLFFTITNCRIARSRSLTRRMNFKYMRLSAY